MYRKKGKIYQFRKLYETHIRINDVTIALGESFLFVCVCVVVSLFGLSVTAMRSRMV